MVLLFRNKQAHVRCFAEIYSTTSILHFLQDRPISSSSLPLKSTSSNQHSFTVSYLIDSCGITPEQAQSASRYVNFKSPDRPNSVLTFLKNHGLSKTQISNVARKVPAILSYDPKKTLLPKFEFLYSIGISKADLAKAITAGPAVLKRSLENQIIPSFNFFKALLHSNTKFITAFKRYPEILTIDHKAVTIPNIEIMRQHGVPESKVVFLLTNQPRLFTVKPEEFKKTVNEVKEMGFDPSKLHFVLAVHALRSMRKSTWQRKVEVYGKWGWSEEQTIQAFGKNPWCMMASEEKIMAVMDFYVNTMGWESSRIARRPKFVSLSLEKRIVPRCSVVQVLLSKGLIDKKRLRLATLLESTESSFLEKFVIRAMAWFNTSASTVESLDYQAVPFMGHEVEWIKCTERQFPPADVAQMLDSAVTGLQLCCSQSHPIYAEMQKCMGIIRNQILAVIPT
ncbi:hypothetical protein TEA_028411 [Camellia sinensis var. sinensis]|uniref:Uncharacterized protein n=1 Tax=Camellia sinensis var. sinensis TaxID=542762 RepID=A0A4S4EYA9_CAMSN|nr:hypothetical protein TEA_028411 [Camellia sinensis var. sinensis]